jgi:hypothetical protein
MAVPQRNGEELPVYTIHFKYDTTGVITPHKLSLQRLTLLRQRVEDPTPTTATEATPPTGQTTPTTPDQNRGRREDDAHEDVRRLHFTPTPVPRHMPKVCKVYFAPILDETAVSTANFFVAVEANIRWKVMDITWSKASTKGGKWIVLPVDKQDNLHRFHKKPEVGGKFIVISWVGPTIEETLLYELAIMPLTPLVITPLFSDYNPKQAMALIAERSNNPSWGPTSNAKKFTPAKAFQAKVWTPPKRNQILQNAFFTKPNTCITPVLPVNDIDHSALILNFKSPGTIDTGTITDLIKRYMANTLPRLAVIAQFYNHVTKEELPKWLLGFNYPVEAEKFAEDKDWPKLVLQFHQATIAISKCGEINAPPKKSVNKAQSKKKRGGGTPRGRGRSDKK